MRASIRTCGLLVGKYEGLEIGKNIYSYVVMPSLVSVFITIVSSTLGSFSFENKSIGRFVSAISWMTFPIFRSFIVVSPLCCGQGYPTEDVCSQQSSSW